MNKFKTISAIAITLMSTAIVSAPASAQSIFAFPGSSCQATTTDSASRLGFDDRSIRNTGIDGRTARIVCPINTPSVLSKVFLIANGFFSTGANPSNCTFRSYRKDATLLGSVNTQPTSDGKALVALPSIIPGDYHTLICTLQPGQKLDNYQVLVNKF